MAATILTTDDLDQFKCELFSELKTMFNSKQVDGKLRWLKNSEVKKLLKISNSTLQTLRANGTLSFTKIGGIIYYDRQEIDQILEDNRVSHKLD